MRWMSMMILALLLGACSGQPETAPPETTMPVLMEEESRMKVDATHMPELFHSYYSEAETEQLIEQGARVYQLGESATMFELPNHVVAQADAALTAQMQSNPELENRSGVRVWVVKARDSEKPATVTVNIDGYRLLAELTGFTAGTGPATHDLLLWGRFIWQFDGRAFEKITVMEEQAGRE